MPVNADKPHLWKADVAASVDFYNDWFMEFAPKAYRETRVKTTKDVEDALHKTHNLHNVSPDLLKQHPEVLPMLRMATAPPIARDRLIGLAGVPPGLVFAMENDLRIPPKMKEAALTSALEKIGAVITKLADRDLFIWLDTDRQPEHADVRRAATIVADRLCGAAADPIIRNSQESRQLKLLREWLEYREYKYLPSGTGVKHDTMAPGSFAFRLNVPILLESGDKVNIPVDAAIAPKTMQKGDLPLFIEAKSAGDFTNTNKRRKEEAMKMMQLRHTYGKSVRYILFLCGYFDSGYLGYEASEGIDWVWEHRIDDLSKLGV